MFATKNFAYGKVLTAPSPAGSGTTLVLESGQGARFPDPATVGAYPIVIKALNEIPISTNAEIVTLTARSTDTLTITRQAESTAARTIIVGDEAYMGITAGAIDAITNSLNSWIVNETPTGTVNGSNAVFTLANTPISGSLMLYRDGQLMLGGGADYTLATATVTFVTAPVTGSVLVAYYQKAAAASTLNADTIDGFHANATPTASNILVLDAVAGIPYLADLGGWRYPAITPTYASASTINVPSGAASIYQKGDRLRWKQGGAYKYGVIVAVADTLLTIAVNTDYTVANSAITDFYYSHEANPQGYPTNFNFNLNVQGFSGTPTVVAYYSIVGNNIFIAFTITGTSNATTMSGTLPIAPLNSNTGRGSYQVVNSGANSATPGYMEPSGTTLTLYRDGVGTGFTNSGTKGGNGQTYYAF